MAYKRFALALSVLTATLIAAGLVYVNPTLFRYVQAQAFPDQSVVRMRVAKIAEPELPEPVSQQSESPLAPPAPVALARQAPAPTEPTHAPVRPAAIPNLSRRIAIDAPNATPDATPRVERQPQVDARVIALAMDDARAQIDVVRQRVQTATAEAAPARPRVDGILPHGTTEGAGSGAVSAESLFSQIASARRPASPASLERGPAAPWDVIRPAAFERERGLDRLFFEPTYSGLDGEALPPQEPKILLDGLQLQLAVYRPPDEPDGYFELTILPSATGTITPLNKDIVFAVDASTSIVDQKLRETVDGVVAAIRDLRPGDRFDVVVFRDTADRFRPGLVAASASEIAAAVDYLERIATGGETNVYEALRPFVERPKQPGSPSVVCLLSDGRPTRGIQDSRALINSLTAANTTRHTVLAVGGGRTVDTALLDMLAFHNRGRAAFERQLGDLGVSVERFLAAYRDPLCTDIEARFTGLDRATVFPAEVPDLYAGLPLRLYGRFPMATPLDVLVRITGLRGTEQSEALMPLDFDTAREGTLGIARGWAREKIYALSGQLARGETNPDARQEILALGRAFDVATPLD